MLAILNKFTTFLISYFLPKSVHRQGSQASSSRPRPFHSLTNINQRSIFVSTWMSWVKVFTQSPQYLFISSLQIESGCGARLPPYFILSDFCKHGCKNHSMKKIMIAGKVLQLFCPKKYLIRMLWLEWNEGPLLVCISIWCSLTPPPPEVLRDSFCFPDISRPWICILYFRWPQSCSRLASSDIRHWGWHPDIWS